MSKMLTWFESEGFPTSLDIMGRKYAITLMPCPPESGAQYSGRACHYGRTFWIDSAKASVDCWSTLVHEVLHAMDCALDMDLSEHQVNILETALRCFFKDNQITLTQEVGEGG